MSSLTPEQFVSWISGHDSIKCTLVELEVFNGVSPTMLYLSNRAYNTTANDTPANTHYLPIIKTSVVFSETLSLDNRVSINYGDISINNIEGQLDTWSNWVWAGRPISIFIGDVRSPRSTFTRVFSGIIQDIAFQDRLTINILLRDILHRLNTSVTERILGPWGSKGDSNQNKESLRPLVFGEVHNITPLLVDDVMLEYMVHDGPIESVIEVRDNGVPVNFTANINQGTFRLLRPAVGIITCSVQGDRRQVDNTGAIVPGYSNTVARIIQRIIMSYGKPSDAIRGSEMDLSLFNLFNASHQQPVGVYLSDKQNILSICQELAGSVGAQLTATRNGIISLVKLDIPTNSSVVITEDDIVADSLHISEKVPVVGSIKLNYCKNWTVQSGILTNILEEHKSLFTREYLSQLATDSNVLALYRLSSEVTPKNTLLISNSNGAVTVEATRLLNLFNVPRVLINLQVLPRFVQTRLGSMVNIVNRRFGLSQGRPGQVVSISVNWDTGVTNLGVLV